MGVVVYPRLATLLKEKNLTVAELERLIEGRFGVSVNPKTLYRLTQADPVQRADLEIAGAAATILGVGLDDLFAIEARPGDDDSEADLQILGPTDSRRMAVLVERQAQRLLTEDEWAEMEGLVATYGRLLHERRVREVARQQGRPVEQVRQEMEDSVRQAAAQWREIEAAAASSALDDRDPALR